MIEMMLDPRIGDAGMIAILGLDLLHRETVVEAKVVIPTEELGEEDGEIVFL